MKPNRDDPTAVGTKEMGEAIIARLLARRSLGGGG